MPKPALKPVTPLWRSPGQNLGGEAMIVGVQPEQTPPPALSGHQMVSS